MYKVARIYTCFQAKEFLYPQGGVFYMPITKETIKAICHAEHITMKELAGKADMNYNGLLDKFRRKSMTVKDLERLLSAIGYSLQITKNECSTEKKEK